MKVLKDNGFSFEFHFQSSGGTIPQRLTGQIKNGITAFIIVRNEKGDITFGLPVTGKDEKIISFDNEDAAFEGAKQFLGF